VVDTRLKLTQFLMEEWYMRRAVHLQQLIIFGEFDQGFMKLDIRLQRSVKIAAFDHGSKVAANLVEPGNLVFIHFSEGYAQGTKFEHFAQFPDLVYVARQQRLNIITTFFS